MELLKRFLKALPWMLISPVVMVVTAIALAATDLAVETAGDRTPARRSRTRIRRPRRAASVVIPNWNGRDLLEKYLPSVIAGDGRQRGHRRRQRVHRRQRRVRPRQFPTVKVLALPENLGFGGGSNAGFRAATNDVVVLLNSDMRVAPDFLAPLLEGFRDPDVFAVSCQIFFSDPNKLREETGLTQGWWQDGGLRVRHRDRPAKSRTCIPCFYGGGGSCAFDRDKFLELGGFDPLLAPFYLEDTDLGYLAWKRGWKVLYQPRSIVYHEHRGTIGKKFREDYIQAVLKKNFLLFCWKNIHEWRRLGAHFCFTWAGALLAVIFGEVQGRAEFRGLWRAFRQLPQAVRSRWRARSLARVSDTEAFLRPLGGYYRDRFDAIETAPERLRVLFVSPYPICPPVHGGGVFMYQTLRRLATLAETHVVELLDWPWQEKDNEELREFCASAEWLVRPSSDAPPGRRAAAARRRRVREQRPGMADPPPDLPEEDRRGAVGIHAAGAVSRRVPAHRRRRSSSTTSTSNRSAAAWDTRPACSTEVKARMEYLRALRYELRVVARISSRCRSARPRIANSCCRFGPISRPDCAPVCAPGSTPRATSSAIAAASR